MTDRHGWRRAGGLAGTAAALGVALALTVSSHVPSARAAAPALPTVSGPAVPGAPTGTDPSAAPTDTTGTDPAGSGPSQVQISVNSSPSGTPLPAGFLGFSVEYGALHQYLGRNPAAINPIFEQLLLGVSQNHNPVLRVGGDSADKTWLALPGVIPPLAVNYTLTPDWLATVQSLAEETDLRLILDVNLATDDPQIAAAESRALVGAIGRHWIADLEVGNEPDLYGRPYYRLATPSGSLVTFTARNRPYTYADYVADFNHWREIPPDLPLTGGVLASLNWIPRFVTTAQRDPDVGMVTAHRYALSACEGNTAAPDYPTIANLLSPTATEGLGQLMGHYGPELNASGRSFRVDELNSVACAGAPGVSDTFAAGLWMLNELFDMAANGVNGVNIHTLPGSSYAPFSFAQTGAQWTAEVRPSYYGMLMFTQAFPVGANLLGVGETTSSGADDVKAFATLAPDGRIRTTIINEDSSAPADVQLTLPASGNLSVESLTAPSLSSTTGVQLGGQSFADPTSTGTLPAAQTSTLAPTGTSYQLTVPAGSAVLLTSGG